MADVGSRTTVGAGSIVTSPLPDDCLAVGNPARILRGGEVASLASRLNSTES